MMFGHRNRGLPLTRYTRRLIRLGGLATITSSSFSTALGMARICFSTIMLDRADHRCGFSYAVDSLLLLLQSIIQPQAALEMNPSFKRALTMCLYVGLLIGALFWGLTADIIGRRTAFNTSLFICSVFAIVAGAAPNWPVLGLFVTLSAFGGGGNLILDTTVFLEYLPSSKQWLLTLLACWWGAGQMIAGLVAWPFMGLLGFSISTAVCRY